MVKNFPEFFQIIDKLSSCLIRKRQVVHLLPFGIWLLFDANFLVTYGQSVLIIIIYHNCHHNQIVAKLCIELGPCHTVSVINSWTASHALSNYIGVHVFKLYSGYQGS